ncbi:hypothetical protein LLG95_13390 [bacterium]|nr:hypothetical protein [bacterium]
MLKQFILVIVLSLVGVVPGFARPQKLWSVAARADVTFIGDLGKYSFVKVGPGNFNHFDIVRIDRTTPAADILASNTGEIFFIDKDYFVFIGTVTNNGKTIPSIWAVDVKNPNPQSTYSNYNSLMSFRSVTRANNDLLCNLVQYSPGGSRWTTYPMVILDLPKHQRVWGSAPNANYSAQAGDFALINAEGEPQSLFDSATNQMHPLPSAISLLGAFQNKCYLRSGRSIYLWDRSTNNLVKYCDMVPNIFAVLNNRPVIGVVGSPTQFYAVDGPAPVPLLAQPVDTGSLVFDQYGIHVSFVIQDASLLFIARPTTTTLRVWELRAGTPFTLKPIGAEFPALVNGRTYLEHGYNNIYLANGSHTAGYTASRCDLESGTLRPFWQGKFQPCPTICPLANNRFLFHAVDAEHGCEFRVTDMNTTASTSVLVECGPGALEHDFGGIRQIGSAFRYAFAARTPASAARDIWITDGTTAGTRALNLSAWGISVRAILSADPDKVIFSADESAGGTTQRGIYVQSLRNATEDWLLYRE